MEIKTTRITSLDLTVAKLLANGLVGTGFSSLDVLQSRVGFKMASGGGGGGGTIYMPISTEG